ncbi:MAG: hypothetical protein M1828_004145 [Chrysothrix sp. TS-e1954]|nr:MAG: hypothetical protein M1828_004145 [Chrysothrix sp. TS-e1954]
MSLPGDLIQMFRGQLFQTPEIPADADFSGKTIIVTGANSGLGLEASKHFYELGASRLILGCRNRTKADAAVEEIKAVKRTSSSPAGDIEVWSLDQAKFSSVLAFGERAASLPRLDVFVANAGIDTEKFEVSDGGHESTLVVNVISTFLLAMLAIPELRRTARSTEHRHPTHLVLVGSVLHIVAKPKALSEPSKGSIFKTLDDQSTADMADRYSLSNLIRLLCARQLAAEIDRVAMKDGPSVILNYVNPGWCKTALFRTTDDSAVGRAMLRLIGRTGEEGSRTLVDAAVAGIETQGKYLSDCSIKPESTWVRSKASLETERAVWAELVDILEGIRPGVTKL